MIFNEYLCLTGHRGDSAKQRKRKGKQINEKALSLSFETKEQQNEKSVYSPKKIVFVFFPSTNHNANCRKSILIICLQMNEQKTLRFLHFHFNLA